MGFVETICISRKKGIVKKPVVKAEFIANWGIAGDAHAGEWHRQVSLLAGESIDQFKQKVPQLKHGAFAENMVTRGVDLAVLETGSVLRISRQVVLEVTQIGKECHTACAIRTITGDCIMPSEGIFAKVLHGGIVQPGDQIVIEKTKKEDDHKSQNISTLLSRT